MISIRAVEVVVSTFMALILLNDIAVAQSTQIGLSTKAIQALENCFDSTGDFTCDPDTIREDFDMITLHPRAQTYGTFDAGTNGRDILIMPGSRLGMIGLRFEGASTVATAGVTLSDGYLLATVDATDNEGLAYYFPGTPVATGQGFFFDEDLGDTKYCEISLQIGDVSETDTMWFGWVTGGNTITLGTGGFAVVPDYALFILSDAAGDLDIVTEVNNGGTNNDDTGIAWLDGQEKILRVILGPDSVSFSVDGVAVTQTNAVLNLQNAKQMECQFGFLNATGDGTPSPGYKINHVEMGRP